MSREEKAQKIRTQLTHMAHTKDSWSINELRIVLGLERIVAPRFDSAFQFGDPQMDKLSKLPLLHLNVGL